MTEFERLQQSENQELSTLKKKYDSDVRNIRIKYERKRSDLRIKKYTSTFEEFASDKN